MKKIYLLSLIIIFSAFFFAACNTGSDNEGGTTDSGEVAGDTENDDSDDGAGDDPVSDGIVKITFDWQDESARGSSSWSDSANEDECLLNAGTDGTDTYLLLGCTNGNEALNISIPKKTGTYTVTLNSYLDNKLIYFNTTTNHVWDFSLLYYTSLNTNSRVYYDYYSSVVTVTITEIGANLLHGTFSGTITRQDLNEDQYQLKISSGVIDFHNQIGYYDDPYALK